MRAVRRPEKHFKRLESQRVQCSVLLMRCFLDLAAKKQVARPQKISLGQWFWNFREPWVGGGVAGCKHRLLVPPPEFNVVGLE